MPNPWSHTEVELIIQDYFAMLTNELAGKSANKTEHRRRLKPLLNNRSDGSIEFKHQNISAVLAILGQPYIMGYKPRYNYQKVLDDRVIDYLMANPSIENEFRGFATKEVGANIKAINFSNLVVDPPEENIVREPPRPAYGRRAIKTNYILQEQYNQKTGLAGEKLALEFEKWQLTAIGKEALADRIEWVSQTAGDGLGFDILSCNPNGSDKYIEVKTTKLTKEAPFYFTQNELNPDYSWGFVMKVKKPKKTVIFDGFRHGGVAQLR